MGGEMIFTHHDKPISNLIDYEQLVQNIVTDCKNQVVPVEFNLDKPTEILSEDEKQMLKNLGVDDDYIVGIILRKLRNGSARDSARRGPYYILFPKNPNTLKTISNVHARGFSPFDSELKVQRWIHNWMVKFVVTFPGVYQLYYGDGYSGYSEDDPSEILYSNGRDYPVKARGMKEI